MIGLVLISGCLGGKSLPVSRPVPPGILIDYQRTGGIAGADDRLVIFDNGVAVISSRTTSSEILLNQTDLEAISRLFSDGQFSMLEGNYTSRRGNADLMKYRISYHGKNVNAEDSAIPPALVPVIEDLNRIMSRGLQAQPTSSPIIRMNS